MARSLGYCFTLNNYTEQEYQCLLNTDAQYVIIGKEVAPETGTPHLQGFIQFKSVKSLKTLKKLNARACWNKTKGSADQNIVYCSKEGRWEEKGVRPVSPKKKGEMEKERYEHAYECAKKGDIDSIDKDIVIRHLGNLEKIVAKHQAKPEILQGELQGEWIYGKARCGKTSKVFKDYPDLYIKDLTVWWDGYDNHDVVLIDDMDPFHKSVNRDFKIWSDRYPFVAKHHGGQSVIRPKKIVVTSQYCIDEIWEDQKTREAMHGRFKEMHIVPEIILAN